MFSALGNAYAQRQTRKINQINADLNRAVAKHNANLQRIRARDALFRGQQQVAAQGLATRRMIARQRVTQAAGNIAVNTGSAAEVQDDTQYWATIDRVTMQNNALREAYGYENQAAQTEITGRGAYRPNPNRTVATIAGGFVDAGRSVLAVKGFR